MDFIFKQVRYALRQLRRQPGLSASVVITLSLAIGANTAIFSFVNALLVRPFPFKDPDQLVEIYSVRGGQRGKMSMREVIDIREQIPILESLAAHTGGAGGYNYSGDGHGRPEEWRAILTTGNLLDVLGVQPALGGAWPEHSNRERDYRVILSHAVWQRAFGGRTDVVGKTITLDHAPGYVIHGVAPAGLDFPHGAEVYRSIGGFTSYDKRDSRNVVAIARLKRPHTPERLQAELAAVGTRLAQAYPNTNTGLSFRCESFRDVYSGDVRPYLLLLLGAVGFVLLIACGNVINLLLSRALAREREIGVKIAIGAGRRHIIGELLLESVLLALLSAAAGLVLAWWWMKALRSIVGTQLPLWMQVELDGAVLAFTIAISVAAGVLSGLTPALHLIRNSLAGMMREGGRGGTTGIAAQRLRDSMIVVEIALAVVLLAGAGLLMRGFMELQSGAKGFQAKNVATFRVALGWRRYGGERITRYYEQAIEALQAIPGVQTVALVPNPPLARQEESTPNSVQMEGQSLQDALHNPYVIHQQISERYFDLIGIPLKAGRAFTNFDNATSQQVAIVSERLAARLWPGESAIGKRLRYDPAGPKPGAIRTVVGVAGNVQHAQLGGEPSLDMYIPFRQEPTANQYVLARTTLAPSEYQRRAEQVMHRIDSEQSIFDVATYEQRILDGVWQLRLSRSLLVLFATVALALAGIGIYGVMAYVVGQRTREIGIRMALGATAREVQTLVVWRGLLLGVAGLALGLGAAAVLGIVARSAVRTIPAADSVSYIVTILVLGSVIIAASWIPALRASRIDPASTLRAD